MTSMQWLVLPLAAATFLACGQPEASPPHMLSAGDPVPDYAAATVAGDTLSLADLRGEAVMLNVWATWCAPCRAEMPLLEELHDEYAGRGLRVVGVSVDDAGMRPEIERFVQERELTFTILHDPEERVSRVFRARAVPETYLIDRGGNLVRRWVGKFDPRAEDVRRDVLLALESE